MGYQLYTCYHLDSKPFVSHFQKLILNMSNIVLLQFSLKTQAAIKSGNIADHRERTAFVRCVAHYEPMLPRPTEEQYTAIARALLDVCPTLKDNGTNYWVSF